ncbi:hypothetical protein A3A39_02230 [Candidatus Kaiserbacteria bacterium RIFCSPLOWO2_01_FULL_54_13]|uniref:Uncharacterized protein n=1 Tax=Candidatus Kaiserbacteria bacterium RIFCSPLOWO2_01_FULL_54_13 TaxID=1798512 RepID=A0A1F6F191_9BACT|nr:MAG: hypothetical protein A3A39_02230 [Candidatus Kaiserbacteria bacterium RIFCSPLOWO2_01_FULL_54_13]
MNTTIRARSFVRFGLTFLIGVVIGIAILSAFAANYAYFTLRAEFTRFRDSTLRVRSALFQRAMLLYGIVVSIDTSERTLVAEFRDQLVASGGPIRLRVRVPEDALIVRQSLLASGTEYVALSEETNAQFSDIAQGTRIAVILENAARRVVPETSVVIFGNPL